MTDPVDPSALPPRQRAAYILSAARSDLSSRLWRAALGSDQDGGAPRPWQPPQVGALPKGHDTLSLLSQGPVGNTSSFDALITALEGKAVPLREPPPPPPISNDDRPDTSLSPVPVLPNRVSGLGTNSRYAALLDAAARRTGIPSSALAAIIDAEAGRKADGSWNPMSRNPRSSAAGLGQFLSSTWLGMARQKGSWLHEQAQRQGLSVSSPDNNASQNRSSLLALRYDPTAAIETIADFARANIERIRNAGVVVGNNPAAIAQAAYIGHHLGPGDALRFYNGSLSANRARYLLGAQIGAERASQQIATSGDAVTAHRNWLMNHVNRHVRPDRYTQNELASADNHEKTLTIKI